VEPLVDVGVRILAQVQVDLFGIVGADDVDRAGVEHRADLDGHRGILSWPVAVDGVQISEASGASPTLARP